MSEKDVSSDGAAVRVTGLDGLLPASRALFEELLVLTRTLSFLPDKPDETPESTLATLWHFAAGQPLSCQAAAKQPLTDLSSAQVAALRSHLTERIQGTPLSYIVGRQCFMGMELLSAPEAVIPRLETELLAGFCLEKLGEVLKERGDALVVDQFTGSGNLPLCFAKEYPQARIYGCDIAPDTIELARRNALHAKLPQVEFRIGDMLAPFDSEEFVGKLDLISGAPPYISSKKVPEMQQEISQHEPELAFEAGPFGIKFFQRMISESPRFLRPGGWLAFEVGLGQGPGMAKRLQRDSGYDEVVTLCNEVDAVRVVAARRAGI